MTITKPNTYSPAWFENPQIVALMLAKLAAHQSFKSILAGRDAYVAEGNKPLEEASQICLYVGLERLGEILEAYRELQGDLEELSGVRRYGDEEFAYSFVWAFGRPIDEIGNIVVEENAAPNPRPSSIPPTLRTGAEQ